MKKNLKTYLFSTVGVAVMFFILVAVYVINSALKVRVDMTAEKVFTLSAGTKAILSKLDTPIQIRFYYSESSSTMPMFLKTHAQRIQDLLSEYQKVGKGNIDIKQYDPQPDSDAEDKANLDGVEGQMLQTGEKMYLGVAISCLDAGVNIPYLAPERERLLEYDLSRAITQVMKPEKPTIGIMSALPIFGEMNPMMMQMGRAARGEAWVLVDELKRDFNVKQVEMTADKIDSEIKVLVVIYPRDITEKTEYALDQFVLRGGKMVAFLDPLCIIDSRNNSGNPMQRNMSSGASLDRLLKAWGIEFDKSKVLADMNYVTRIGRNGQSSPAVLSLTQKAMDTNDVVTSQIDNLLIPFAGSFGGTPAEGLKRTILIKSSTQSQQVEKMLAEFSGEQLTKDFSASGKEQALAIRLEGKFKTAFAQGKPKDAPTDPKDADAKAKETPDSGDSLKESKGTGLVILVADADMLNDQFCVEKTDILGQRLVIPRTGNLNFLQNIVEQLGGDSNLIAVRSRGTINRPFTVVKELQAKAEDNYRVKIKTLETKLQEAQTKLNELQAKKDSGQRFILSPEQKTEIEKFRKDQADVNKELKQVRKNLRQDIDSLETKLKCINIALMPFLVTVSGIALAVIKRKRTAAR